MKGFAMFLAFLVTFFFFFFVSPTWFVGMGMIRALFAASVAGIVILVVFGIIDIFLPSEKED